MSYVYWAARLRTVVTLLALALLVLLAVKWGFDKAFQPFPERADPPRCVESEIEVGDTLRPAAIMVSVLNAGGTNGLASRTLGDLEDRSFAKGDLANADEGVKVRDVAILTDDRKSPAVKLLRSYLGGRQVQIIDRPNTYIGINVVVGPQFTGVTKGRPAIKADRATTVCSPPALTAGS